MREQKFKFSPQPVSAAHQQAAARVQAKFNQALALHQKGQLAQARVLYEEVIKIQPRHFDALHLLGVIATQTKYSQHAVRLIDKAIAINPNNAAAYSNRGIALNDLKQHRLAVESYNRAIALKPDYAEAYNNRGIALGDLEQRQAALESYDRAIAYKADYAEAYYNRGNILNELKRHQAAAESYERAIALKPDYVEAYNNRGIALRDLKQYQAALDSYDRAIALKPDYAEAYNNRGTVLKDLKQHQAARENYDRAIALKPDYAEAYNNRGIALNDLKQHQAALASYDRAIACKPDYAEAKWNKGMLLLLLGRFAEGWEQYEWRWNISAASPMPDWSRPLWLGETPILGKNVLLWGEQGAGDAIQFLRYVPQVVNLAAEVFLHMPPTLAELAQRSFTSVKVCTEPPPPGQYDCHCPLASLSLALRIFSVSDIPAAIPYLTPDPQKRDKWRKRLKTDDKPLIGIAWQGNPQHPNDNNRSIPFDLLRELFAIDHIRWVILQNPLADTEALLLKQLAHCVVASAELLDYDETAALTAELDLVISVDTSIAHLAGALGKPVWVLLPYAPDWRWLLEREDSPWYPTARLFRQPEIGDWESVIASVTSGIKTLFSAPPELDY